MASIVLAMGVSHGPTVVLAPEIWAERARAEPGNPDRNLNTLDGRFLSYAELVAERGERFASLATIERFREQHGQCQRALDRLGDDLERVKPDALIVIGSDQDELYGPENIPAVAMFHGAELATWKRNQDGFPEWRKAVSAAYGMDRVRRYPGSPDLARDLIERLVERGFDVAAGNEVTDPLRAGFGHAWGFVAERLFRGRAYPMIPVLINGFRPPNVPSPRRCFALGAAIRAALEESARPARVGIIASGGLSHMLCEEDLDRRVLAGVLARDEPALSALAPQSLQSGSSEIRSWIALAGAVAGLRSDWLEYVPVYRTPVGSGMGCAFGTWTRGDRP